MRVRHRLGATVLAICAVSSGWAAASAPQARERLAINVLAAQVGAELAAQNAEAPVGLFVRGESNELSRSFETVLASELARRKLPAVVIDAPNPQAAEAEARTAGTRSLVRVSLSLEKGLLHARGDLLGTWVNFWSGRTPTRPASPAASIEASVEADAHALAFAAVALSTQSSISAPESGELRLQGAVFARLPRWTAALAAGDLDGDGREEVVALTDDEVLAFSSEGRLIARREHRILPSAMTPCREPFGAIAVLADPPRVAYASSQRARGEMLAFDGKAGFRVLGMIDDALLGQVGGMQLIGKLNPGQNTFQPTISLNATTQMSVPRPFTTLSVFGGPNGTELAIVFPEGLAFWRKGLAPDSPSTEIRGLGAATALADVDGDGTPELITSEPTFSPNPEILRVLRDPFVGPATAESLRFKKEIARGRALQIVGADLDADRTDEVLVAVWMPDGTTELQVYRRVK